MSSGGLGLLILGAVLIHFAGPILATAATAFAIGGAAYVAIRGGAAAAKKVYSAYKEHQSERALRVERELEMQESEIARAALEQQRQMQAILNEENRRYEQAVQQREDRMNAFLSELKQSEDMESIEEELHAEFAIQEEILQDTIQKELVAFSQSLTQKYAKTVNAASSQIMSKKQEYKEKINRVQLKLDERETRYRAYAEGIFRDCIRLMTVLTKEYDCEKFARTELTNARTIKEQLEGLLSEKNWEFATDVAASFEDSLLQMQAIVHRETAIWEQNQMCIDSALAELKAMEDVSRDLLIDDRENEFGKMVTQKRDANYWSEGRLQRLWQKAGKLKNEAGNEETRRSPVILTADIRRITEQIRMEYHRTKSFLINRKLVRAVAEEVVKSMDENGWEMTGKAFEDGDPRNDVLLQFQKGENEKRSVRIRTEYDETIGQYRIGIEREAHAANGIADEDQRSQEDTAFNASLDRRGLGELRISCDQQTYGKN